MNNDKPRAKKKVGALWIILILVLLLAGGFGLYQALQAEHQTSVQPRAAVRVKIPPMPAATADAEPEPSSEQPQNAQDGRLDVAVDDNHAINSASPEPSESGTDDGPEKVDHADSAAPLPQQIEKDRFGEEEAGRRNPPPGEHADLDNLPPGLSENEAPTAAADESAADLKPGAAAENVPAAGSPAAVDKHRQTPDMASNAADSIESPGPPQPAAPFTIQVGAFRTKGYADRSVEQLRHKGYDSYVVEVIDKNERPWYLVRFGHFQDRSTAATALATLKEKEEMAGTIARSITR